MAKTLPPRPANRFSRLIIDSWTPELLACLLSVVATVAIGIVLLVYNEKPVPKLGFDIGVCVVRRTRSHQLTILLLNIIVSILGTVSKSALLLCVASSIGQYRWLNLNSPSRDESLLDIQLYGEASRGPWGSSNPIASRQKL